MVSGWASTDVVVVEMGGLEIVVVGSGGLEVDVAIAVAGGSDIGPCVAESPLP